MKLKSIPLATIRVAGVVTLLVVSALGAADVNDDGRPDVRTVSKLGAVIFLNQQIGRAHV